MACQNNLFLGVDVAIHTGLTAGGVALFTTVNPGLGAAFGLVYTITQVALIFLLKKYGPESMRPLKSAYCISSAVAALTTIGLAAGAMLLFGVPFTIATLAVVSLSLIAGSILFAGVLYAVSKRKQNETAQPQYVPPQYVPPPQRNEALQPPKAAPQNSGWQSLLWFHDMRPEYSAKNLARNISESALDSNSCPYKKVYLMPAYSHCHVSIEPDALVIYFTKNEEEKEEASSRIEKFISRPDARP